MKWETSEEQKRTNIKLIVILVWHTTLIKYSSHIVSYDAFFQRLFRVTWKNFDFNNCTQRQKHSLNRSLRSWNAKFKQLALKCLSSTSSFRRWLHWWSDESHAPVEAALFLRGATSTQSFCIFHIYKHQIWSMKKNSSFQLFPNQVMTKIQRRMQISTLYR